MRILSQIETIFDGYERKSNTDRVKVIASAEQTFSILKRSGFFLQNQSLCVTHSRFASRRPFVRRVCGKSFPTVIDHERARASRSQVCCTKEGTLSLAHHKLCLYFIRFSWISITSGAIAVQVPVARRANKAD
jgi:hypothetical protein